MVTTGETTGLLAPDPALGWRDAHLDPVGAAARLAAALGGATVEPLGLVRSKYRIGESLRVVHRLRIDGQVRTATARLFADGRAEAVYRRALREAATGETSVAIDRPAGAVWWLFPADRKLHRAADVMGPDRRLADELELGHWVASEVAEYAPERSLTVRAIGADGSTLAYAKAYAAGTVDTDRFVRRATAVADHMERADLPGGLRVRVPRVVGRSDDRTVLALEPVPGTSWRDLTTAGPLDGVFARLGAAIAHLHQLPVTVDEPTFGRLAAPRVVHSAELVALARPELAGRLEAVAEVLAGGPPAGSAPVLLHGDCHPKNTLVDPHGRPRLSLIDLDQAGAGSAAADLASLLARLEHGVVLGEHDLATAIRLGVAFLDGYRSVRPLPSPEELHWHRVAALVAERAIRAVNRVNRAALASLDQLVETTLALAAAGPEPLPTIGGHR